MGNTEVDIVQTSPRMNSTTKILKKSSNYFRKKISKLSKSSNLLDKIEEGEEPILLGSSCPANYCSDSVQIKIRKQTPEISLEYVPMRMGKSWSPINRKKELILSPLVLPDKHRLPVAIEVTSNVENKIQSRVIYINQKLKRTMITPPMC